MVMYLSFVARAHIPVTYNGLTIEGPQDVMLYRFDVASAISGDCAHVNFINGPLHGMRQETRRWQVVICACVHSRHLLFQIILVIRNHFVPAPCR